MTKIIKVIAKKDLFMSDGERKIFSKRRAYKVNRQWSDFDIEVTDFNNELHTLTDEYLKTNFKIIYE